MKRRLSLILGIVFSLFFLWLGFRGLALREIGDELSKINLIYPVLAIPVYLVAYYILTWRWYYLLRPVKDIHPNRLYPVVLVGYMANNLLPLRLGEVMRVYILKKRHDVPIVPALTTIFVERVFDGLTMLAFIFAALLFVDFEEPTLNSVILITTPLFFGALAVFFWLASNPVLARKIATRFVTVMVPGNLRTVLLGIVDELMTGLEALRSKQALILIVFYSFWSWITEASTYWIVMQAFSFEVSFYVLLLVIGFGNLSTILPSTAGYVGTFHAVAILTLTAFDIDRLQAGSYAVVMHATLWLPVTLIGFITFLGMGFAWRDFNTAQEVVHKAEESPVGSQSISVESEGVV